MPQIADRKSMARYICVDKGATHPALQREELPKHMAIYADYGVTGTDLRQRPELNRLLTDCRAGRVNCMFMAFAISFKRFAFGLRYPISYCAMRFALLFPYPSISPNFCCVRPRCSRTSLIRDPVSIV